MIPIFAYRKLLKSLQEHRLVESEISTMYQTVMAQKYRRPWPRINSVQYARKNFFSTLFLAIYRALEIPPERRLFYGVINHCLRGLVTGTDNLLDNEYKEMLPLNFPDSAIRFKSVMHILLFDRFMFRAIERLVPEIGNQWAQQLHDQLFKALVPIGAEEAMEEGGVETVISPADILSSVHMYKGGKLLCLAFIAPLLLEKERQDTLSLADQGIFSIGLALQVIDDITDFYEDINNRNHNYLVSSIYFKGANYERQRLADTLAQRSATGPAVEKIYPHSLGWVMEEAIGEAVKGFSLLEQAGFWLDRHRAFGLIRHLFYLRGVKRLLPFFPKENQITRSLS